MADVTPATDEAGEHEPTPSPLQDARITAMFTRMRDEQLAIFEERRAAGRPKFGEDTNPWEFAQVGYQLEKDGRDLIYLLARGLRARRVVEFATSLGVSATILGAAVRDNGGGIVIGSEIVPEKVAAARANIEEVGLQEYVQIREGDARETLADVGGPIDLVLIDGWPTDEPPSLALSVLQVLVPQLRPGALVVNDNGERDYLGYVRDRANHFRSQHLYFESRHVELSLYDPPTS